MNSSSHVAAPKTLLFGDDMTEGSDLAWLWVNSHPWPGWNLEILHAEPPPEFRAREQAPVPSPWEPSHARVPFDESRIASSVQLLALEDPRLALMRPADLLVIGARGPGLVKSFHLGSTAEWLMAHPPSPLVVVRHGRRTRSVLLCFDDSADARCAATALCHLPWIDTTTVTVIGLHEGHPELEPAIAATTARLRGAGADTHTQMFGGDVTKRLVELVHDTQPDLVAIGARGRHRFGRQLGTTAAALAHDATTSVLVATDRRAEAAEDRSL